MENERLKTMLLRWSIGVAGLIALFWMIFYLTTGYVPTVTSIRMGASLWVLPKEISRWWDILFCLPFSTLFVVSLPTVSKKRIIRFMVFLVAGLLIGELFDELLFLSIVVGLLYGLVLGKDAGVGFALGIGLGLSINKGLAIGFCVAVAFCMSAGLGVLLNFVLLSVFEVIRATSWKKVRNWLLVR